MSLTHQHPLLALIDAIESGLKDVADVDPCFLPTSAKQEALERLTGLASRMEEVRLRVLATADDVATEHGARDAAAWLAHRCRLDRGEARRTQRLADGLSRRAGVAAALREGRAGLAQAEVIIRALDELPPVLEPDVVHRAEAHLVESAAGFGPRELRIMGRRVLDVVAPEVGERHELRLLERDEAQAARSTFLVTGRRGDGTTEIRARVADLVADRLLTYLHAFTSPRRDPGRSGALGADRRPYDQQLGHAFGAFLEAVDPARLPLHGGDATTVIVAVDHQVLVDGLGTALVGDVPVTAGEARRLACTAAILPLVLGGDSEILDLGRTRRLYTRAQRKVMAVRDVTCRAEGCDIPAAWCEAHHGGRPWASGGRTDLADGMLLCGFHHHRAHDHRYRTERLAGGVRFHRRT